MAWHEHRLGANLPQHNRMKPLPRLWLIVFVALFLSAMSRLTAEETKPGILFLRLRLKDGAFSLVSATNAPGVLKAPRGTRPTREFQLVVEAGDGKAVWAEEIADPSVERLEYADPAQPGAIQVKEVRRAEVEFMVRVPVAPGQRALAIYRRTAPAAKAIPKTEPSRDLVVRIPLPNPSPP